MNDFLKEFDKAFEITGPEISIFHDATERFNLKTRNGNTICTKILPQYNPDHPDYVKMRDKARADAREQLKKIGKGLLLLQEQKRTFSYRGRDK